MEIMMVLYTKGLYREAGPEDGVRICITSRLTDNTGRKPVPSLYRGEKFDIWMPILGPEGEEVLRWYRSNKTDADWQTFTSAYLAHLQKEKVLREATHLSKRALEENITLLCVEELHVRCHRGILATACQELEPKLTVCHR